MFQVIADRAEKAAVIVTTNLPFSSASQVIPQPRLCKALIDRLTDQAHIVTTGSDPIGSAAPRRSERERNHDREDKANRSAEPASARLGGSARVANIRQHQWANLHCHSQ